MVAVICPAGDIAVLADPLFFQVALAAAVLAAVAGAGPEVEAVVLAALVVAAAAAAVPAEAGNHPQKAYLAFVSQSVFKIVKRPAYECHTVHCFEN